MKESLRLFGFAVVLVVIFAIGFMAAKGLVDSSMTEPGITGPFHPAGAVVHDLDSSGSVGEEPAEP